MAKEAIYHVTCMTNFRLWMPSDKKRGRPIDSNMLENFKKNLCLVGKGYWQWIVHFTRTAFENGGIKRKDTLLFFEEFETKISITEITFFLLNSQANQILFASRKWHLFCLINWEGDHTFITSTRKGGGRVLKFVTCLGILLFLNNRSIVHFCGWWG